LIEPLSGFIVNDLTIKQILHYKFAGYRNSIFIYKTQN